MIPTTKNWLNGLNVTAVGNENSGNHNDKPQDMSLDTLIRLLNEGYDRVTWIGSKRDKEENEICERYDSNRTTWSLEAFINVNAGYLKGIKVTAAMSKEDYDEADWNKLVSSPGRSLKYAQQQGFTDLPQEIIDSIASDDLTAYRFVNRFLKVNQTDTIPQPIVDATLSDADSIAYLYDRYSDNPNLPVEYKEMSRGIDEETEDGRKYRSHTFNNQRGTQFTRSDSNIPFDAPIFAHSHVGCQCGILVWKSTDPDDCIFLDANGW